MSVNWGELLRKPAGEAKAPKPLPIMDYVGVIKSYEVGDNNQNKTPYIRFHIGNFQWPDEATHEERAEVGDISGRQFRKDFWFTDGALHVLDKFLRSCGIDLQGKTYDQAVAETRGAQVLCEMQQYVSKKTGALGNQLGNVVGTANPGAMAETPTEGG